MLRPGAFFEGSWAHETAATRINYSPASGYLFYDADGSHHGDAPVHFATLAAHLTLTSGDFLVTA